MKRRIMTLALSHPLADNTPSIKMDLICLINGAMEVILFECTTYPSGDS
jgi:hypothetical protein